MRTLLFSAAAITAFALTAPAFAQSTPQDSALAPSVNDTATPPRTNPDAASAPTMGAGMGGDTAAPMVSSTTTTVVAPSAGANGQDVSATLIDQQISNGPVPDTAANRAKYGSPLSNAGKRTKAAGN